MDGPPEFPLPALVRHSDGTNEPFEASRLHSTLYNASVSVGCPDTFLSRELTDAIIAFLDERTNDGTISTTEIVDVSRTVLSALGQSRLAACLGTATSPPLQADKKPLESDCDQPAADMADIIRQKQFYLSDIWAKARPQLVAISLREVYPHCITDAHEEGLIQLGQLTCPRELASMSVRWPVGGVLQSALHWRDCVGEEVVFDSPEGEPTLLQADKQSRRQAVLEVVHACKLLGLSMTIHLACAGLPDWASASEEGFFRETYGPCLQTMAEVRREFVELAWQYPEQIHLHRHVTMDDFLSASHNRVDAVAKDPVPAAVVLDSDADHICMHEGLTRNRPAVLQVIDLNLHTLIRRVSRQANLDSLVGKVLSLVRLSVSAAKLRRDFIRKWQVGDWPAFLLDRAHLVLRFCGWESMFSQGMTASDVADFSETLARRLRPVIVQESRQQNMTIVPIQSWRFDARVAIGVASIPSIALWENCTLQLPAGSSASPHFMEGRIPACKNLQILRCPRSLSSLDGVNPGSS